MPSKKKLLTSAIALGTAAALTLGGTFAWQSISQTGTLEASNVVNPGGRLHDDFDGENKDVYVENFDEDDIFARVRLEEFFEIVMNAGTKAEKSIPMIGTKTPALDDDGQPTYTNDEKHDPIYDYTYEVFTNYKAIQEDGTVAAGLVVENEGEDDETTHSWWTWTLGGQTVFMPTFNKNKDSLKADINGKYLFNTGVLSSRDEKQYTDMVTWEVDDPKTAYSINDIDSNQVDELENLSDEDFDKIIETGTVPDTYNKNVKTKSEEHFAKSTAEAQLISMTDWLNMVKTEETDGEGNTVYNYDETTHGNYWVYDEDGWVYWSAPIHGGEATGLLLNGIELAETMDNSWYYGLNVVGQFCTAGDLGEPGVTNDDGTTTAGTGFYADGGEVSTEALTLLDIIGVNDTWSEGDEHPAEGGDDNNGDEDDATNPVHLIVKASPNWYSKSNSIMNPVTLTASGYYWTDSEYTVFESDTLATTQWALSGNTSADTKLDAAAGETNTLTIGTDETGELTVKATVTYQDYTKSTTTTITSEPHVGSIELFNEAHEQVRGRTGYVAGTSANYELGFFTEYTGGVYNYDDRLDGVCKEKFADDVTFTLLDKDKNEGTVEGVTIQQGATDKTMLTVTVGADVTETFYVRCEITGIVSDVEFKMTDVTAPTVSIAKDQWDGWYVITISGLHEYDFPLTLNCYELTSTTQEYSAGTKIEYGSIYLNNGELDLNFNSTEAGSCTVTLDEDPYDGSDTITLAANILNSGAENRYVGISVADTAGNVGKLAAPQLIEVKGLCVEQVYSSCDFVGNNGRYYFNAYYDGVKLGESDISKLTATLVEDGDALSIGWESIDTGFTTLNVAYLDVSDMEFAEGETTLKVKVDYTDGTDVDWEYFDATINCNILTLSTDGSGQSLGIIGEGCIIKTVDNTPILTSISGDDISKFTLDGNWLGDLTFQKDEDASTSDCLVYKTVNTAGDAENSTLCLDYKHKRVTFMGAQMMGQYTFTVTVNETEYSGYASFGIPGGLPG